MTHNSAKDAQVDHPIHELLAVRYSPYAFDARPVERSKLLSCLEAARSVITGGDPWEGILFNEKGIGRV